MNIFEFEKKYKNILKHIGEWNYLRISIGKYLHDNRYGKTSSKKGIYKREISIKSIFYGFTKWFKRYDYLFFSDESQRKNINGIYYHRFFDPTVESLQEKNLLLIEKPIFGNHKYKVKCDSVASELIIILLTRLIAKLIYSFIKSPKNLEELLKKEKINIPIKKIISNFKVEYFIYKILLKLYKPKGIFLTCYYCRLGLVKVANELGITVIEFQHGVINNNHYGYSSSLRLDKNYLPKYLLSFGDYERHINNILIANIIPIGSFYLEYLSNNFFYNKKLKSMLLKYNIIIGISMQDEEWERKYIFDFLYEASSKDKNILYILIPRKKRDIPNINTNVIVYDKLDCYNIIMHCHIHMTLYSSCAMEAPALGIPNILLNFDNIAFDYYKDILNPIHTKYITSYMEMKKAINDLERLSKEEIKRLNSNVIKMNYCNNLRNFIKDNLLDE